VGRSAIGFSENDDQTLIKRISYLNKAFEEGHEIASHANGHFDGSKWTHSHWMSEFKQFTDLIFRVFTNNKLILDSSHTKELVFQERDIIGFRAPQLGVSSGLWSTMDEYSFQYDTSRVNQTNYWPKKETGNIWNFPLASVKIAGTGKRTLSMDYNFYVAHSNAKPDPGNAERYEKEMLETYLHYFESNYNGNRAPIHIGHHFSQWNGGAYWKALKKFAEKVCGLPEVKCVNYNELTEFMNSLDSQTLSQFQKAQFEKMETNTRLTSNSYFTLESNAQVEPLMTLASRDFPSEKIFKAQLNELPIEYTVYWSLQGEVIAMGPTLKETEIIQALEIRNLTQATVSLHVKSLDGNEIDRSTHEVQLESSKIVFSHQKLEDRALLGDLPEAHLEE